MLVVYVQNYLLDSKPFYYLLTIKKVCLDYLQLNNLAKNIYHYNFFFLEFLPFMDTFLDENLITGRSWSLKQVLRFKAYIYIDHLITNLHSHLSLNFLVRVIHIHFSDLLDPTLEPE